MKEYSPKSDLWSKIQQRRDFDSQVKTHVQSLPAKMPKADLWLAIESELDQKTPLIPIWKYGVAAASIALIITISSISYLQFREKEVATQVITELTVPNTQLNTIDENVVTAIEPALMIPQQIEQESAKSNTYQTQAINRETQAPINVPQVDLATLSIQNTFVSELIIPPTPELKPLKTLHEVRISWGITGKNKLRTIFGAGTPEEINDQQISRAELTPNSIKIKFKKQ